MTTTLPPRVIALGALAVLLVLGGPALAGPGSDQEVGQEFRLTPADLPPPGATESVSNGAETIARPPDATLRVPPGFAVNLFADGLGHARWMVVAENGDVFLAQPRQERVSILRDADGDGRAELVRTFLDGMAGPHGLAIHDGYLYVADVLGIWRVPYQTGDERARAEPEPVTAAGAFGGTRGHWTRNVVFTPDGARFFVAIGSRDNVGEEDPPRATVQVFDADGGGQRTFAAGLRNPVGIAFHPETRELYVVVNERDGLGDGLVPDYLTRIEDGDFYGWPYAYSGPNPDPDYGARRPDLVAATKVPDVLFESHSAPLGLAFYNADRFPAEYRGDAFVALHGSWNKSKPTGYKIVRVPFESGRPTGVYRNFAVGFWLRGEATAEVWGRPAGLAIAKDGSLLVADDAGGAIWRIAYVGAP
ncbi:MAG: PQQ-dependent sugar dehydrogenase [Alphaproteobacteria bacterium]